MSPLQFIILICVLMLAVLALRAFYVLRGEKGARRGSPPGKGYHEIEANYFSGGGGGGQQGSFRVPRDPQEYARRFVPKNRR